MVNLEVFQSMSPRKGKDRFEKSNGFILMEGFDGEYYVFNERNNMFVEVDEVGAYALSLINGKRVFSQILDDVREKFKTSGKSQEEIFIKISEAFESSLRIGAIRKKTFW